MPAHGSWGPVYQSIWTHRKTFELAALLGLNETYAAAHVLRLNNWAIDNAPDGDLSGLSDRAIAYGAGWTQEVSLFVAALIKSGYLDDGRVLHDWQDYAGKLIERRQDDAERKRNSRGHAPDVRGMSNGTAAGIRRREEETREEQRRGEKTITPPKPPPQAEGALAPPTDGDRELWHEALRTLGPGLLPANAAKLAALELLGRAEDGGLRLRAPPGTVQVRHWGPTVARALTDAGDEHGASVAIIET